MSVYSSNNLRFFASDLPLDNSDGPPKMYPTLRKNSMTYMPGSPPSSLHAETPPSAPPISTKRHGIVFAEIHHAQDACDGFAPTPSTSPSPSTRSSNSSNTISPISPMSPLPSPIFRLPSTRQFSQRQPSLRRKGRPREQTLRQLRTKDSEADLRMVYERHTNAYLDDSIFENFTSPPLSALPE